MKLLSVTAVLSQLLATSFATIITPHELPHDLPRSVPEFRNKHPYRSPAPGADGSRPVVTIRPSANDTDDVAAAFKAGLEQANNGGTLYLPANQTFVIGQPLDLTFLNDVHVHLDGEILFTDDVTYWQSAAFTHPFQNTSTLLPILQMINITGLMADTNILYSHVLEMGWQQHQDLRRGRLEWQWPAVVE